MNQPARGESAPAGAIKRLGRALAWPIRRLLDPRFAGLSEQITVTHDDAVRRSELTLTQLTQHGLQNQEQLDAVRQLAHALQRLSEDLQRLSDDLERLREVVLHQGEAAMETNAIFGRSLADLLAASDLGPPADSPESRTAYGASTGGCEPNTGRGALEYWRRDTRDAVPWPAPRAVPRCKDLAARAAAWASRSRRDRSRRRFYRDGSGLDRGIGWVISVRVSLA